MSRILIKLATRGRPDRFRQAIRNIQQTVNSSDYLIVVSIDEDDASMTSLLDEMNRIPNVAAYIGKPWGKVHAINRDISLYIPWSILVNFSDDMSFRIKGWDDIIRANVKAVWGDTTDFFYHANDSHVSERLPTMAVMGREFYERFGYIYHPAYRSVSCDAEQFYVARILGKHKYFSEPIVEHQHPVNVKTGWDKTYKANDAYADQDTETYFRRMQHNFYIPFCNPSVFERFTELKKHKR